ncbi:MAG: peptide-methionine (R)-S-oxide reductase MsrB [bacterium]|nr:peptide-methionine (R)-S-oxide reductase MsrB [bacterium]
MADKVEKSDTEWRAELTPDQYEVTRQQGTEQAFTGKYHDCKIPGTYECVGCRAELFSSEAKYDSGTGWPSFFEPIEPGCVAEHEDHSRGIVRIEVKCKRCEAHLGHVFPDGPQPTGMRYCMNSAALLLKQEG